MGSLSKSRIFSHVKILILQISCVLQDFEKQLKDIHFFFLQHGSTYGGSPLASRVAIESLKVHILPMLGIKIANCVAMAI